MIQELRVKNLALIKSAEIEFEKGFHVLTGETGAGKSLLLGSLGLALGGKASAELIGKAGDSAAVELTFEVKDERIEKLLEELMLPIEDNQLILSRKITEGRSVCRVNGETLTAAKVKEISELLIDIHGQHEHQSLLKKSNHIKILDSYIGNEIEKVLKEISSVYVLYAEILNSLDAEDMDERAREREISLLEHEIRELESAALKPGEDEEAEIRFRKLQNVKRIAENVGTAMKYLGADAGYGQSMDAASLVGGALKEIRTSLEYDEELGDIDATLSDIEGLLNEVNRNLSVYADSLSFDAEEYMQLQERLDLINTLKLKYGNTIEEILKYYEMQQAKLMKYQDMDAYLEKLKGDLADKEQELERLCSEATEIRKKGAQKLSQHLEEVLAELNFNKTRFEVDFKRNDNYSRNGVDDVEFLISLNPGESLKPLKDVASGGELSRIMLALRSVGAKKDGIGTLVFDEIDAGISGRTATQVAKKLAQLSGERQVICITHLPQIAAYADKHYKIEKRSTEDDTTTVITTLSERESLEELTRLLGETSSALETAKELKIQAQEYRKEITRE